MERKLIQTTDGSHTLLLPEWQETYHSKFGAIQEAYHVFIKHGFSLFQKAEHILEVGFGTGLNMFITYLESIKCSRKVSYEAIEAYPLSEEEVMSLNYPELIDKEQSEIFYKIHNSPWGEYYRLSENFSFKKRQHLFEEIKDKDIFDLIYYDAFGARVQPELWEISIFEKMFEALRSEGALVTYASKGSARRAMESVGFQVKKYAGPLGRREMVVAYKK